MNEKEIQQSVRLERLRRKGKLPDGTLAVIANPHFPMHLHVEEPYKQKKPWWKFW
jgi:hypothetical protein